MQATRIELRRSAVLLGLIAAMAVLALVAIAQANLPRAVQGGLDVGLLAGLAWHVRQLRKPLPELKLAADGQIQIGAGDADWRGTEVLPGSFVAPGLCVLRVRTDDGRIYSLTLLPDSAAPDELRRLRVSLRWASRTRSDIAPPDAG